MPYTLAVYNAKSMSSSSENVESLMRQVMGSILYALVLDSTYPVARVNHFRSSSLLLSCVYAYSYYSRPLWWICREILIVR